MAAIGGGRGREFDGKGRHTTRGTRLTELDDGTRLIDTPGVREFGLWGLDARALAACFPEFADHATHCRFNDCDHDANPDCAVRAAVADGAIAQRRYDAYRRLRGELE